MIFLKAIKEDGFITKEELKQFLIVLNPMAPHITSEIYERVFGGSILDNKFPEFDENVIASGLIELPIQINGKFKKSISVDRSISQEDVIAKVKKETNLLEGKEIKKVIYVQGRIFNIIC